MRKSLQGHDYFSAEGQKPLMICKKLSKRSLPMGNVMVEKKVKKAEAGKALLERTWYVGTWPIFIMAGLPKAKKNI